ncbi:sulfotransferase domain-containing protein [Herbidospora sp. NBRC 101105]|uniref:sulfotransferase domain-containing protein n=1 Tax=Herbidospora sp. NBRC 101105 TaxID=3032195 RepID=UPI0024A18894|nr:sulfotransferase domain-containing protein [Herbidospora sp. NBRC 101105]GLX99213.1 sulfotransferase [Herbidospora sp. NBRC 101105]
MPLAWVASYPRSGNTWTRILLASYLRDAAISFKVAELGVLDEAVTDLIDVFEHGRALPLDRPGTLAVKTHFLPGADVHRPYRDAVGKVLYLIRDPRDVLHSAERFLRVGPGHREAFAHHFVAHRGARAWEKVGYGSWPASVLEWTSPDRLHRHFPGAEISVVRYEDLRRDPVAVLREMIVFLGFDDDPDPGRVERAVANSRLDVLRGVEKKDDTRGAPAEPFFGDGLTRRSLAGYGPGVEQAYARLLDGDAEFAGLARDHGYAS